MIKAINVNYDETEDYITSQVIDALPEILEAFENQEYENLAMDYNGGGFCHADYQGHDGEIIFVTLTWKYNHDKSTTIDDYHIRIDEVLNSELTPFIKASLMTP